MLSRNVKIKSIFPAWVAIAIFSLLVFAYGVQGIRSAHRLYPSKLGYQVRAFDVTPRWIGTKNLLYLGINPYSEEGSALIEEAYFGRVLNSVDESIVKDKQHFAYPLYVIFLYAPTVMMSFPNALLVIWVASFLMCIASIWIWLKLADLNKGATFVAFSTIFLTWPHIYIGLQSRQPLIVVFFLISIGVYLIVYGERKASHIAAGVLLFVSTIKPQNALMPVTYLLVVWLPSLADKHRTESVWLGFLVTFGVSLILTEWLVPGWIPEFVQSLSNYRNYAGTTGAESFLGKGMLSLSVSVLAVMVAMAVSILNYRVRRLDAHLIGVSYILVLQGLVFPAHLYTVMMGIPIVILSLGSLMRIGGKTNKYYTFAISLVLVSTFCVLYKYWIHILSEAPLPEGIRRSVFMVMDTLPDVPLYVPIPLMLVLGIILFRKANSEGRGKFRLGKLA